MELNSAISRILLPAYGPCPAFKKECLGMRWHPEGGHVPRGFAGAAGSLGEIELVLVFAEPGDPHETEAHEDLSTAYSYATKCFCEGKDFFHRNVQFILKQCWPGLAIDQQMRKALLIDSVLCSAKVECGSVPPNSSRHSVASYLSPILELVPQALIVGLGNKAQNRMKMGGIYNFQSAISVAPPGCNRHGAKDSWCKIAENIHQRRKALPDAPESPSAKL
jgi:hypothetical protein